MARFIGVGKSLGVLRNLVYEKKDRKGAYEDIIKKQNEGIYYI